MKLIHHYNNDHNTNSAKEIVPLLLTYIKPVSVIDIGCGVAQWLKVFNENGVQRIIGVDGPHVPKDKICIERKYILEADLENINVLKTKIGNEKFDLTINLEVAEHLLPDKAEEFVHFLTTLSDTILFSAAIPNQTGENHYNEQPHTYWQGIFAKYNFVFLDLFREYLWNNPNVNWWYKQNMFLVVKKGTELCKINKPYTGNLYIHPELFDLYVRKCEYESRNTSVKKAFKELILTIIKK